ncbi:MAG: hypothetical protein KDD50_09490, partial [Bdellovibrionales bacterium]|nr:hypothetical protein [Bdellovibrionales bacterium]
HFHNLPEGQKEAIEKALYDKFKKIKIQRRKEKKQAIKAWVKTYGKTILIYSILTLVTFSLLWLLSRPSENYDKDRGSPWGKRFKFLLFDD